MTVQSEDAVLLPVLALEALCSEAGALQPGCVCIQPISVT